MRFWLSFADPTKPKGQQFLGVVIAEAQDIIEAAKLCWEHGCNPGGEIAGWELTDDAPYLPLWTLLSKDDLCACNQSPKPSDCLLHEEIKYTTEGGERDERLRTTDEVRTLELRPLEVHTLFEFQVEFCEEGFPPVVLAGFTQREDAETWCEQQNAEVANDPTKHYRIVGD